MEVEEFSKRTIDLNNNLERLMPALSAHVDQSPEAAVNRVRMHCPEDADKLLGGRVRIINVWRPLSRVKSWPLVVCQSQSVHSDDLVACDIVRRQFVGETLFSKFNPRHRWMYLSDQDVDEPVLMKIYDSNSEGQAQFCLHASSPIHSVGRDETRESIELRFLVFSEI